jgi:hypothetical protein
MDTFRDFLFWCTSDKAIAFSPPSRGKIGCSSGSMRRWLPLIGPLLVVFALGSFPKSVQVVKSLLAAIP